MTYFFFRQAVLIPFSLLVLALHLSPGHALRPQRFHQASEPIRGLFGTSIGDIVWSGRYLWVGTESGVARLDPAQSSGLNATDWVTFTELNGLGRGAISALDAVGDTVWVATLVDSVTAGQGVNQAGTGLSFSHDGGDSWHHIPNEFIFDPTKAGFERSPSTTILNACFDISIDGEAVYAAFFAGSTVRSLDQGRTWEPFLPGGADEIVFFASDTAADSLRIVADSLAAQTPIQITSPSCALTPTAWPANHSCTALLRLSLTRIRCGSALPAGSPSPLTEASIGKMQKCASAQRARPFLGHPAGNWVVALERQVLPDGTTAIWAGTNTTTSPGQTQAISVSRDLGQSWGHTGPTFAWDFAFTPNFVWAGTDQGLLASPDPTLPIDSERVWDTIEVVDGQPLTGTFVGLAAMGEVLWAGAEHGLGRSEDEGNTWRVIRDLIRTRTLDEGTFVSTGGVPDSTALAYAAPNPFAPSRETTTIVFSLSQDAEVSVAIYDFASGLVRDLATNAPFAGGVDHRILWDGLDQDGQLVANGTYFYRIALNTGQQAFGRVVVLD